MWRTITIMADGPWRAAKTGAVSLLIALAAGCDDAHGGFEPGSKPRVGDVDPNARLRAGL